MKLGLKPLNPIVGDLAGNAELIARAADEARAHGCDMLVCPELSLVGYPPKDLLLQQGFLAAVEREAHALGARASAGLTLVFGAALASPSGCTNSLLAFRDGTCLARYDKRLLPTYDVFDEDRYFIEGTRPTVIDVPARNGVKVRVGLSVCEDLWRGEDVGFAARYAGRPDPVAELVRAGAGVIVNPSASPFVLGKGARHAALLQSHAMKQGVVVAAVNQLGGNDELIFDGRGLAFAPSGACIALGERFSGEMVIVDTTRTAAAATPEDEDERTIEADLAFSALVLGVRDYLRKTGFSKALLGLSGGIDSALTAAIACAALGPSQVLGVAMPGPYSSSHALEDAQDLAARLGMTLITVPIASQMQGFRTALDPAFAQAGWPTLGARLPDLAEENLQSRLRGTTLMAISNRTGALVLTTGNKSELAVGYCTLYGDMNGGLAVLSDVTKRLVYAISRRVNEDPARFGFAVPPIPPRSIEKPPSAELAPNQKDQDSLPPYDVLDEILSRYVERHESAAMIRQATGFDDATILRVVRLIDLSEFKRKQAAIGLKLTGVAFGSGRRWPIAQRWRPGAPTA